MIREFGINPKTVAKWRKRQTVEDQKTGPKDPSSTVLSEDEEAMVVAFRRHTLLPLDDCLYALQPSNRDSVTFRKMRFDLICEANDIEHRLTKPNHPWSSEDQKTVRGTVFPRDGQVERMNCTIRDATVKRYHYESHDQLRRHFADLLDAYNFARRLKTLSGLTPYEYICKIWTSEPDRSIINPIHQMTGPNT